MFIIPRQMLFVFVTCALRYMCLISLFYFLLLSGQCYAKANVDIALFYTDEVAKYSNLAQLHQLIQKRTKIANNALAEAQIPLHRNIVAFEPVAIDPQMKFNARAFLSSKRNGRQLLRQAERFGADYVTVLTRLSDRFGCGLAQVGGRISMVVVSEKCNKADKDYILAHEWGHLDGAAHSERDSIKAKLKYGVGYVCDGKSTIMNMQTASKDKHLFYAQADSCGKADVADVVRLIKQRMQMPGAIQNSYPAMDILATVKLVVKHRVMSETSKRLIGQLLLSKPLQQPVSVQLYTEDITTQGDFTSQLKRYVFPAGKTVIPFNIDLVNDGHYENDEQMLIGLRYPEKVGLLDATAKVTIVSDDGP